MNDEEIIRLFFSRSEQAISELNTKYGKLCHNISYNILGNHSDAEECVNDAYLGAWNAIPPANPMPLRAYICKIVRNLSIKLYYRREAAKRNSTYDIAMSEIEDCLTSVDTVETELEVKELAHTIESFLDTMAIENRIIFMLRYAYSYTYADIAKRVGLTEKNVSVRLTRIRQKLKHYLAERED